MSQVNLNVTGSTTSEDNLIAKYDKTKTSEMLLQLIDKGEFEFFHNEKQDTFCRYKSVKSNVYEIRRIESKDFRTYLSYIYRKKYSKTISNDALKESINELNGRALHDGEMKNVFLRVAEHENKIYIDLCDAKWRVIEISDNRWKILDSEKDMPVYFERNAVMKPLPDPISSGDVSKLWELINVPKEAKILIITFILECYRIRTQFPILVLIGQQGSGKSTTQEVIRKLIDPSICNLRTAPRKPDDLIIEASKNYLLSYNNVSGLSDVMHDDFCCISTGGGFSTRQLFKDTDQIVCNICRPSLLNGISNFVRRPDFLDRAIIIELEEMAQRISDNALKKNIEELLPTIFGGLLNLMVNVLKKLPTINLDNPPRMVDYALLGITVEKALEVKEGTFIKAYHDNRETSQASILESSPVILALIDYLPTLKDKCFRGTPSVLLQELTHFKFKDIPYSKNILWPETGKAIGDALSRYAIPLKQAGISVIDESKESGKRNSKGKMYRIELAHDGHTSQGRNTSTQSTSSTLDGKKFSNDAGSQEGVLGALGALDALQNQLQDIECDVEICGDEVLV